MAASREPPVLWFNPRCSKCRTALELLRARGVDPQVRDYLKEPPTADELTRLLSKLPDVKRAVRTGEEAYGTSGLTSVSTAPEIAAAILRTPILLERPILETARKAAIGRPPERIVDAL